MNQRSVTTNACDGAWTMAELELTAFFAAVAEMFGPEQAELAAEDWLRQLPAMSHLPGSAREWRLLSVKASARLATRLNAQSSPLLDLPTHTREALCSGW